MIRRTMSSSGSPTCERSIRSSPASSANRSSASGEYGALARVDERVVEARDLGRVDAVGDLRRGGRSIDGRARAAALAPGELGGAAAQQPQVARADRPARPGEQREQRGVGGHVVQQVQDRDDLGDLGQPEQPGQADDLDRDVGLGQRVEDLGGVRVVAGQHPDVGPRPSAAVVRRAHRRRPARPAPRGGSRRRAVVTTPRARLGLGLERARRRRARRRAGWRGGWPPRGSGGRSAG